MLKKSLQEIRCIEPYSVINLFITVKPVSEPSLRCIQYRWLTSSHVQLTHGIAFLLENYNNQHLKYLIIQPSFESHVKLWTDGPWVMTTWSASFQIYTTLNKRNLWVSVVIAFPQSHKCEFQHSLPASKSKINGEVSRKLKVAVMRGPCLRTCLILI